MMVQQIHFASFLGYMITFVLAVDYKDLVDTSRPDTPTTLSVADFSNIENFEEVDIKPIIMSEMKRTGQQMSADTERMLDQPIWSSGQYQGDIRLPPNMAAFSPGINNSEVAYNAIRDSSKLWPNGVIPYVVSSQYGAYARQIIASSIADYQKYTCVKVVPRTNQRDYVHVKPLGGCNCHVGRIGGAQVMSLANNCLYKHTIIHEFMHAAGFWHEQSRNDRDNYVNIYWNNILNGFAFAFDKYPLTKITHLGTAYDLNSVMHYPTNAFSRYPHNGASGYTIVAKNGQSIGNSKGFSQNDITKINKLYSCGDVKVTTGTDRCIDEDSEVDCKYWANDGECDKNADFMKEKCKKSCGLCDDSTTVRPTSGNCFDEGSAVDCKYWANDGECSKNADYMKKSCKKSCGLCDRVIKPESNCRDDAAYSGNCEYWANDGECEKSPEFMKSKCRKSCDVCESDREDGCIDNAKHAKDCGYWADKKYCYSNQKFMHFYCKKSCGVCGNETTTPTPTPSTTPESLTTMEPDIDGTNCTYQLGSRATFSLLDTEPAQTREHCCQMCSTRQQCAAMTWTPGKRCWMHTTEYKDNIKNDCTGCYFAEM